MSPVKAFDIRPKVCEVIEKGEDCVFNVVPELSVETRTKAVGTRAGIRVHLKKGILNLLRGKWRV